MNGAHLRQTSLDSLPAPGAQDPEFVAVQILKHRRSPADYTRALEVALRLAREMGAVRLLAADDPAPFDESRVGPRGLRYAGGVSVNDVRDEIDPAGRLYSASDWGSFFGTLCNADHPYLVQKGRVRSLTPGRKCAYVGLYELGEAAVREAPEP